MNSPLRLMLRVAPHKNQKGASAPFLITAIRYRIT